MMGNRATVEVRSLVPYCPLLREKCLGEKCAWHKGKGCGVVANAYRKKAK